MMPQMELISLGIVYQTVQFKFTSLCINRFFTSITSSYVASYLNNARSYHLKSGKVTCIKKVVDISLKN